MRRELKYPVERRLANNKKQSRSCTLTMVRVSAARVGASRGVVTVSLAVSSRARHRQSVSKDGTIGGEMGYVFSCWANE